MDRLRNLVAIAMLVTVTGGCQQTRHTDFAAFVHEPRPAVFGEGYRVGVPDELVVTVVSDAGVETFTQTLGPDGHLWLDGYGRIAAAGRTCEQIADELRAIATHTAADKQTADDTIPAVAVRVQTHASQKVFAFGQVHATGGQTYDGTNTVLDVVAAARPNVRADTGHVQVLRPSPDGSLRRRMTVDIDAMVRGGDTTLNVVLDPGDVVFVPATTLGSIGLAFEQVFGSTAPPTQSRPVATAAPTLSAVCTGPSAPAPPPNETTRVVTEVQGLSALQETLASLTAELQRQREVREASAEPTDPVAERERIVWVQRPDRIIWHQGPPLPEPTVFTTADVQRGGAGESPRQDGVRFWGP